MWLNLSHCFNISDISIEAVAHYCAHLTHLNVEECRNLTDNAIIAVANRCKKLQYLNIMECYKLTSVTYVVLVRVAHNLDVLDYKRTKFIPPQVDYLWRLRCAKKLHGTHWFRDAAILALLYCTESTLGQYIGLVVQFLYMVSLLGLFLLPFAVVILLYKIACYCLHLICFITVGTF